MRNVTRKRMFARKVAAIGVDRGGTWLRVEAVDQRGRSIRSHREPSPPVAGISATLDQLWRKWRITELPSLVVASAGVWTRQQRDRLRKELSELARQAIVTSDVEAAYQGALGERPGIILIAGTGSIALARSMKGRWIRRGGHGPVDGDEGSAYWIGRAAMAAGILKVRKQNPSSRQSDVARVASLAPKVLALARAGDPAASDIVRAAQMHLANLARSAAAAALLGKSPSLSWAGALMENAEFRAGVIACLREKEIEARLIEPRISIARAASLMAIRIRPRSRLRVIMAA